MTYLRTSLALALVTLLAACGEDTPADTPAGTAGSTASGGSGVPGGKAGTAGAGGSQAGAGGAAGGAAGQAGAGQAGSAQGGAGQAGSGQAGSSGAAAGAGGQAAGSAGASAGASGDGGTSAAGGASAGAGGDAAGAGGAAGNITAGSGGAAGTGGQAAGAGGEAAGQAGSAAAGGGAGPGGAGGEAGTGEAGASAGGEAGAGGSSGGAGGAASGGAGQAGASGSNAAGAGGEGGAGGSGGSSAGGAGAGAGQGGAGSGDALAALSLEFSSPSELSQLTDLFPALHATLDVDTTTAGHLAVSPLSVQQTHWYSEQHGPLLYRSITGNFVAETSVQVGRASNIDQIPSGGFSAGGFVVRDPSSSQGDESWVMYNIGHQINSFAREAKTTRPASGGGDSLSTLYLNDAPSSPNRVRLRVCRVGAEFRLYHRHENEASWVEETYTGATSVQGNGSQEPTPGAQLGGALRFSRPDLPATLQVGLIAGNWSAPFDLRADFDYLRFGEVSAAADCLKNLGP